MRDEAGQAQLRGEEVVQALHVVEVLDEAGAGLVEVAGGLWGCGVYVSV